MFQYSIVPLKFVCNNQVLWSNETPNSIETVLQLYLVREKESNEEMMKLIISSTDIARCCLNENGATISHGHNVHYFLK